MLPWKNGNVNGENYRTLRWCNMLESTGMDGYFNVMVKGKGTVGKHPMFWFGELGAQLGTFFGLRNKGTRSKFVSGR